MSKTGIVFKTISGLLKTGDAIDVAARHFIYKLFEATNGQPMAYHPLRGLGGAPATVARAVERGWVIVRQEDGGKPREQSGSLTDAGRRLARTGLRG